MDLTHETQELDIGETLAVVGSNGWRCCICNATFPRAFSIEHHMTTTHASVKPKSTPPTAAGSKFSEGKVNRTIENHDVQQNGGGAINLSLSNNVMTVISVPANNGRTVSSTAGSTTCNFSGSDSTANVFQDSYKKTDRTAGGALGSDSNTAQGRSGFTKHGDSLAGVTDSSQSVEPVRTLNQSDVASTERSQCMELQPVRSSGQLEAKRHNSMSDGKSLENQSFWNPRGSSDSTVNPFSPSAPSVHLRGGCTEAKESESMGPSGSKPEDMDVIETRLDNVHFTQSESSICSEPVDHLSVTSETPSHEELENTTPQALFGQEDVSFHKLGKIKRWICTCGEMFETKHDFKHHSKNSGCSLKTKVFFCPSCGEGFNSKYDIKMHLRTSSCHSFGASDSHGKQKEKPVHGERSTRHKHHGFHHHHSKIMHMMMISGRSSPVKTPWECPKCQRHFFRKWVFKAHLQQCGVLRLTEGKPSFHCPLCGTVFRWLVQLQRHYFSQHKTEMSSTEKDLTQSLLVPLSGSSPSAFAEGIGERPENGNKKESAACLSPSHVSISSVDTDLNDFSEGPESGPGSFQSSDNKTGSEGKRETDSMSVISLDTNTSSGQRDEDDVNELISLSDSDSDSYTLDSDIELVSMDQEGSENKEDPDLEKYMSAESEGGIENDFPAGGFHHFPFGAGWRMMRGMHKRGHHFPPHHHPPPPPPPHGHPTPPPFPHFLPPHFWMGHHLRHNFHPHRGMRGRGPPLFHCWWRGPSHMQSATFATNSDTSSATSGQTETTSSAGCTTSFSSGGQADAETSPEKHGTAEINLQKSATATSDAHRSTHSGAGKIQTPVSMDKIQKPESRDKTQENVPTEKAEKPVPGDKIGTSESLSDSATFGQRPNVAESDKGTDTEDKKTKTEEQSELLSRLFLLITVDCEHGRNVWYCPACGKTFLNRRMLKGHYDMQHAPVAFPCPKCDEEVKGPFRFNLHVRNHHGCSQGSQRNVSDPVHKFIDRAHTDMMALHHQRMCNPHDPPPLYNKLYTDPHFAASVSHAVADDSNGEGFRECPVCFKKFRKNTGGRQDFFERHVNSHFGIDTFNFRCEECGKTFLEKSKFVAHQALHQSAVEQHVCATCGKSYQTKNSLKRHERVHTGERPHKCEDCGEGFLEMRALLRHRMTHTGKAAFTCSQCGAGFTLRNSMLTHMRAKHTGEKPYSCICGKTWTSSSSLYRHRKKCLPAIEMAKATGKPFEHDLGDENDDGKDDDSNVSVEDEPVTVKFEPQDDYPSVSS